MKISFFPAHVHVISTAIEYPTMATNLWVFMSGIGINYWSPKIRR